MNNKLAPFAGQQYFNLESFRKNGEGVRTPLWFAEEAGVFYIYSQAEAWKVKRIRNNPRVRLAPCDMRGKVKGEWVEAEARILSGNEAEHGHELLRKKYGWLKRFGDFFSRLKGTKHAVVAIRLI